VSATVSPGPGLDLVSGLAVSAVFASSHKSAPDLAIDLAVVVLAAHYHRRVEIRNRDKAQYDPTIGRVVNTQVVHLVW
jgi:hypothetical protein